MLEKEIPVDVDLSYWPCLRRRSPFDVDLSYLPCGTNSAIYFFAIEKTAMRLR